MATRKCSNCGGSGYAWNYHDDGTSQGSSKHGKCGRCGGDGEVTIREKERHECITCKGSGTRTIKNRWDEGTERVCNICGGRGWNLR
jgi:DnaJ-class molecular chaperone